MNPLVEQLRAVLEREFESFLDQGGKASDVASVCGFFLEVLISRMPEPARAEALATVHRRICEHDYVVH